MAQKKNIWQRLFSNNSDETSLSVVEKKAIRDSLESEYGLSIQQDSTTIAELSEKHFRRMTGNELARVNQIFQYIPQLAANSINQQAVNAAFAAATEGTFRVRLGAGMHLCRSRLTPGAYRAVGLSDATNQIAGNAELFANNATLTVSNAPQIALGVFNVASLVTGQYFMSQVNTKLTNLSQTVGRLEKLLDAQRHGKLKTAAQELSDIMAKIEFIIIDTDKTNSTIAQLHDIQHEVNAEMNVCQELIFAEIHEMKPDDKVECIKNRIASISRNLVEYQYATQVYGIATLLEVQLRNITDPDELHVYREQIDRRVAQFKDDFAAAQNAVHDYLEKTHALNNRSIVQWIASGAAGVFSAMATGGIGLFANVGGKAFEFVDGLFSDHRKQQKQKIELQVHDCFEPLRDTVSLESPASSINLYIETVGREIEFVKIGDDVYTNLPES